METHQGHGSPPCCIGEKAQSQTGGGKLNAAELRIVNVREYADNANKLGISASGNAPRFDSDNASADMASTKRLQRLLSLDGRQVQWTL